jgi:hypothetical protein
MLNSQVARLLIISLQPKRREHCIFDSQKFEKVVEREPLEGYYGTQA